MYKLLTIQLPIAIFKHVTRSTRNNETLLIVPKLPTKSLVYRGTIAWNTAVKALFNDKCLDEVKIGQLKFWLKSSLLKIQSEHDNIEWLPHNLKLNSILKLELDKAQKPLQPQPTNC